MVRESQSPSYPLIPEGNVRVAPMLSFSLLRHWAGFTCITGDEVWVCPGGSTQGPNRGQAHPPQLDLCLHCSHALLPSPSYLSPPGLPPISFPLPSSPLVTPLEVALDFKICICHVAFSLCPSQSINRLLYLDHRDILFMPRRMF